MAWTPPTTATTPNNNKPETERGHTADELNQLYLNGDSVDQGIFAEMRSNLLLVGGDHYQKRESFFHKRLRTAQDISSEQKLRLSKNHTRKICQSYSNNILAFGPSVGFTPKDDKSPHDQKVADMHHSVWRYIYEKNEIEDLQDDWCDSFVQIGEVAVKVFWDPFKGKLKGYNQKIDEETRQPVEDKDSPIYEGEFVYEEIYGFNLLRPEECKDLRKAEWLGIRKMVSKTDLLLQFPDPDLQKFITDSMDDTYMVFDAASGGYTKSKGQVSIREFYFRPCMKYPKGRFYISTEAGILAQGNLPGGYFPIEIQCFDKIQTTPRGRSPVKQMRPYQAEINRAASKMAEHQITLGDDKLLIQNGTKVSASAVLPGVRSYMYTGATPEVLPGRSGAQYLEYMNSQIDEMYRVMNVQEDTEEKSMTNIDPTVLIYQAARHKKKFQRYIKRFEKFQINIVKLTIKLAKLYLKDDALIYAVGKSEQVNIPEFKQMEDICYEVKIESQSEDIETKLGRQMQLTNVLQYVGGRLTPEQIGQVMRAMPYANQEQAFQDMTVDYDNSVNDILALDRGEQPPVNEFDTHKYCIRQLVGRMKKPDFRFLDAQIQQNYAGKLKIHEMFAAQQALQLARAEQGFIPTGGGYVRCDLYMPDPKSKTGSTKRAEFPQEALMWLDKQLMAQGAMTQELRDLQPGAQASVAQTFNDLSGSTVAAAQNPVLQGGGPESTGSGPKGMGSWADLVPAATG